MYHAKQTSFPIQILPQRSVRTAAATHSSFWLSWSSWVNTSMYSSMWACGGTPFDRLPFCPKASSGGTLKWPRCPYRINSKASSNPLMTWEFFDVLTYSWCPVFAWKCKWTYSPLISTSTGLSGCYIEWIWCCACNRYILYSVRTVSPSSTFFPSSLSSPNNLYKIPDFVIL